MNRLFYGIGCFFFGALLSAMVLLGYILDADQLGIWKTAAFMAAFAFIVWFGQPQEEKHKS